MCGEQKDRRMGKDYEMFTDKELMQLAGQGDDCAEEHLIRKYKEIVRSRARIYFIVGADDEDVIQEGMIGIFKAIKTYDPARNAAFKTFADICIDRQIQDAVKAANRQKHSPLNRSLSFNHPMGDDEAQTLGEVMPGVKNQDPESVTVTCEMLEDLKSNMDRMFSPLEMSVWRKRMAGKTNAQIAQTLGKNPKAVENATQRIKKKILDFLAV